MAGGRKHQSSPSREDSRDKIMQQKTAMVKNIERIKRSIKESRVSSSPIEIECRLDILNSYIEQAMSFQAELDIFDPSSDDRAELEDLCVSTKSLLLAKLGNNRRSSFCNSTQSYPAHTNRLPSMKLPKFSGKYSEYKNFIGLFENLVDNDPTLTDIEKFNHLISCLSDSALGTVKAYQVTDENYSKALASLKRVYDNPCLIFFENISKLFDLPEIPKPSSIALRSMIDTVSAIYDSLLSIGDDKSITNAIIIHLVMAKVDSITRLKWEEQLDYEKLPLWSDCELALNKRYQHISAEESSSSRPKSSNSIKQDNSKQNKAKSFSCQSDTLQSAIKCIFCRSTQHYVTSCPSFSAIPVQQRFEFTKGVPACINCLRVGHTVKKCKASKCRVCSRSHHTLLHQYKVSGPHGDANASSNHDQPSTSRASVNYSSSCEESVVLATALVRVKDKYGHYVFARALLDSGSQINFITEELAQRLQIKREDCNLNLLGIGKTSSSAKSKIQATLKSRMESREFNSEFWVLRSISQYQPDQVISTIDWEIPNNIELADPLFYKPQKVDMLIGAEMFFELLSVGQIKMAPGTPVLQKTVLGWIVSGKYKKSKTSGATSCHANAIIESEKSLDLIVRRFWELEEIPNEANVLTIEQQKCEEHFQKSVRQLSSGRFSVALPFKEDPKLLGFSFDTAKRRYSSLERKLSKDPQVREMYDAFMKEYIDLGHMSIADNINFDKPHYFIPHQCVLRPESTSTKLRVVFDASCKTSSQKSLNDLLMIGPTIQEELFSTLIRFRLHKYAMTADIEKMYRQVLIDEADKDFQLILYRDNPSGKLNIYKLNTVTYGTSSAPFLAIRCLTYLADSYIEIYPKGSEVIRKDFYVDDLLTGADSLEELEKIRFEVSKILSSACFNLAKWFSNCSKFDDPTNTSIKLQFSDDTTKALGTYWHPKSDTLKYRLDNTFQSVKPTRRNILSVVARLYDPLGLVCPVVTKAKILIQELWLHKLDWDESIPVQLHTVWESFKGDLSSINQIEIPRHVLISTTASYQIHGFADASIRAYGCCIYIRSNNSGNIACRLLTGKSKVAPMKTKSLPRLELCAAQLLAKLWSKIKPMMAGRIESVTFWSDSEITLHWIKTHPSTLTTFVANRVSDIQELSVHVNWRHVPTKQNPADIVSRGCNVDELRDSLWFNGPQFLLNDSEFWPVNAHFEPNLEQRSLEMKKTVLVAAKEASNPILELPDKISSYPKLIRIFAYMLRFVEGVRYKTKYSSSILTPKELNWSFLKFIELVQKSEYSDTFKKLKKSEPLHSNLQRLNPFIHEYREENRTFTLLRVGGRLLNAPISYDAKFPLLMPKKSGFIKIYLRDLHVRNCHAGAKALVALLREKIWLINAKEECSRTIRKCYHCFHYKPKLLNQIMGNLPADRVRALRPFKICGVDFCGPINVTLKIRGRPPVKMYIAIFVCFTSKAVHIELVSDLTSDAFILSFQRFIARRGVPAKLYADNATNFGGASTELRQWREKVAKEQKVASFAAEKGVEFAFIPPRAPHFGGLWEAAVKSAKGLLFRTVGAALLTTEELTTLLAEIEAVLNSRPLAALSSDPNDGEALTPAHLLIGEAQGTLLPESKIGESVKLPYLKRWQRICALKRAFWRIWERDYLRGLQERTKWSEVHPDIVVGKLVLVHDDNRPPLQWLTGRIVKAIPGEDGKVRVADVKTGSGVYRRPIHKLALIPDD